MHFRIPLRRLTLGLILGAMTANVLATKRTAAPLRIDAVFVLGLGQKVAVTPTASVKLDKINDSRCKAGAVCVWAGYVSYRFILSSKAGTAPFVLSESMPGGAKSATRQRLTFTLVSVQPAAPPGLNEAAPNYRVTLKVTGN